MKDLDWKPLTLGWAAGLISGIWLVLLANHFGPLATSDVSTGIGLLYIGLISLAVNMVISLVGSAFVNVIGSRRSGLLKESDLVESKKLSKA